MNLTDVHGWYDFAGKTAVITGGAGVLGGEIACMLAGCHANVVILDRDPKLADRLLVRLTSSAAKAIVVYGDVLKKDTLEQAAGIVLQEFGRIDILVNSSGQP